MRSVQTIFIDVAIGLVTSLIFKTYSIVYESAGFGFKYTCFSNFTGSTLWENKGKYITNKKY